MASGINEHHEALRKENFINRQAYIKKLLMERLRNNQEENNCHLEKGLYSKSGSIPENQNPLSYTVQNRKYAPDADQERYKALRDQQYLNYTAKIKGRLTSTDYSQQW
ncbi:unnamed protein product [Lymnaea stagnalis]|uniref:Uncharacterized protein n=1 Tax=Lymnaea stagnalis TaxID=6523 RepID=A0AAV2HHJ3_LYMST